jgi:tRNA(fMet)-specific endonuclease VapC
MGKVIFDTDIFIEIFNKNEEVFNFINECIFFENIATTTITEAELILSAINKESQTKIEKYISDVPIIVITNNSSFIFSALIKKYHLSHNLKLADSLIASICIDNNLPLLTFNKKDFQFIPGLKLITHNLKPVKKPFNKSLDL